MNDSRIGSRLIRTLPGDPAKSHRGESVDFRAMRQLRDGHALVVRVSSLVSRTVVYGRHASIVDIKIGVTDEPHTDDVGRRARGDCSGRLQRSYDCVVTGCFERLASGFERELQLQPGPARQPFTN